jgi:hypothetical protein
MAHQCKHDLSPAGKEKGNAVAKAVGAKAGKGKSKKAIAGGGGAATEATTEPVVQSPVATQPVAETVPAKATKSKKAKAEPEAATVEAAKPAKATKSKKAATEAAEATQPAKTTKSKKAATEAKAAEATAKPSAKSKKEKLPDPESEHNAAAKTVEEYAKENNISITKAKQEYAAVRGFTGSDYDSVRINEVNGWSDPQVNRINAFLGRGKAFNGEVHRGLSISSVDDFNILKANLSKGEMSLNAMSSFSSDRSIAREFTSKSRGDIGVLMTVERNKSGRSIRHLSKIEEEQEVLVPKGARYKVKKTEESVGENGRPFLTVHLEEL